MPRSLHRRDRGEWRLHISSHPHLAAVWWEPIDTQGSPLGSKVGGDKEKELLLGATKPGKTAPQNCIWPCLSTLRLLNVCPAPASQQATQGQIDFRLRRHPDPTCASVFCPRQESLAEREEEEEARDSAAQTLHELCTKQLGRGSGCAVVSTVSRVAFPLLGDLWEIPLATHPCFWHSPLPPALGNKLPQGITAG